MWQKSKAESWSQLGRAIASHWKLWIYLTLLMAMMNFSSHGTQDMYPTFHARVSTLDAESSSQVVMIAMVRSDSRRHWFRPGVRPLRPAADDDRCALSGRWRSRRSGRFSTQLSWIIGGAFLMQFMVQGAWGIMPAHINELSPDQVRGFLPGFSYQCGNLIAASIAWAQSSLAKDFAYSHVMLATAAAIFCGAIVADRNRPRTPRRSVRRS